MAVTSQDAGHGGYARQDFAIKVADLVGFGEASMRHRQAERQDVVGAHSEIEMRHVDEAVDGQPRAGQQCQRQREFDHHQRAPHEMFAEADGSPGLFEHGVQVQPRRLERRSAARQNARDQGCGESEQQHGNVQR